MLIRNTGQLRENEVTDERLFLRRRRFLKLMLAAALLPVVQPGQATLRMGQPAQSRFSTPEEPTLYEHVIGYNNFYELGTSKSDPMRHADALQTEPWSVVVDGDVTRPGRYALEDLVGPHALEERIYRLRCVEGWSMVIPWVGFPLADLLKRFGPGSRAKFVRFETLYDPDDPLPGQRFPVLPWPYVEGLRMDEAMHPLTLIAIGLYGKPLPAQNGAPLRLVVPWKYGFKSIKSIVRISLVETMPQTTWNQVAPREYGFYANVNPMVNHPRWSQAKERRIGEFFKRDTLLFNGYADQVSGLYAGMDLTVHY